MGDCPGGAESLTLLLWTAHMRAAAILGLGCSPKDLQPFQYGIPNKSEIDWRIGLPAAAGLADVILLFGGDGTIHRHLSQLVKLGLPVLVVPAGSGNDFARALGLRSVRDSLAVWRSFCAGQANVRVIDLGVISPWSDDASAPAPQEVSRNPVLSSRTYFCSVAGIGLDSEVTRRANQLPRWLRGHGGYALSLLPTLFRFAPLPMKIFTRNKSSDGTARIDRPTVDQQIIVNQPIIDQPISDQPTILAAFGNTPIYGGGMKIAPRARMDDGQLDVCVIGGIDAFKLACLFPTVYFGRHLSVREVQYFQAAHLRVETETPLDVYADGEFVCRTPVEVMIEPGVLKVVVPPLNRGIKEWQRVKKQP
jgi:diacylglycerol kinase (ATP)